MEEKKEEQVKRMKKNSSKCSKPKSLKRSLFSKDLGKKKDQSNIKKTFFLLFLV